MTGVSAVKAAFTNPAKLSFFEKCTNNETCKAELEKVLTKNKPKITRDILHDIFNGKGIPPKEIPVRFYLFQNPYNGETIFAYYIFAEVKKENNAKPKTVSLPNGGPVIDVPPAFSYLYQCKVLSTFNVNDNGQVVKRKFNGAEKEKQETLDLWNHIAKNSESLPSKDIILILNTQHKKFFRSK